MKSILGVAILILAAALVLSAGPVAAVMARAEVPFAFQANGQAFEAGTYLFETGGWSGIMMMTDPSGRKYLMPVLPLGDPNRRVEPRLCFVRTDRGLALSEVWMNAGSGGHKVNSPAPMRPEKVEVALARR